MIAYLDASALVKRYVVERAHVRADSRVRDDRNLHRHSRRSHCSPGKAVRVGVLTEDRARSAQRSVGADWPDLVRVPVAEVLVERAEALAWDHGLRGYDAVQLASAITWQEAVGTEILLATFDQQLWAAAAKAGLKPCPDTLPA